MLSTNKHQLIVLAECNCADFTVKLMCKNNINQYVIDGFSMAKSSETTDDTVACHFVIFSTASQIFITCALNPELKAKFLRQICELHSRSMSRLTE